MVFYPDCYVGVCDILKRGKEKQGNTDPKRNNPPQNMTLFLPARSNQFMHKLRRMLHIHLCVSDGLLKLGLASGNKKATNELIQ